MATSSSRCSTLIVKSAVPADQRIDTAHSQPVAVVLRPGKTPGGVEVRAHLRRLVRHIRTRWHKTRITFRGDGHYARPEAMTWCENNGIDYIFGLSGTKPLARKVDEVADDIRTRRAIENLPVLRGYTETRHKAKSWDRERRTVARIEATTLGLDIRFVVTSLDVGSAEWIYDSLYCARGQAENLIKLHKTQLASDRTSCRSALANQVRLVLHTAAYWLMLTVRDAIPKARELATAEFATLRLRLLKIAARVVETASRIRLAFAAACPEADLPQLARRAAPARSLIGWACAPVRPTHSSSALQSTDRHHRPSGREVPRLKRVCGLWTQLRSGER